MGRNSGAGGRSVSVALSSTRETERLLGLARRATSRAGDLNIKSLERLRASDLARLQDAARARGDTSALGTLNRVLRSGNFR